MEINKEKEYEELVMDLKNLILAHALTNIGIQKYYQNEPRFNRVYSRDNLSKKHKGWGTFNIS